MTLAALTREQVLAAIAEFNELGRSAFLRKYEFSKAKSYFIQHDGQLYDSKAIVGAALGLLPRDFSGGDKTVAHRLEQPDLGFTVRFFPVLDWTREEIVLACAVLEANGWRQPTRHEQDWRVIELSELLQTPLFHPLDQHGPDFRSPASVGRKTADIATVHPDYRGVPTRGGRLTPEVMRDFLDRPEEMLAEAARLRSKILGYQPSQNLSAETADPDSVKVVDVPLEAHRAGSFQTTGQTDERTAIRREAEMVQRYTDWKHSEGFEVGGKLIILPGGGRLRVDLFDLGRGELIEAKGSSARDYVRTALGQVLDYARYIDHSFRSVLLPKHPGEDMVELLLSCHVGCIYETAKGKFERIDLPTGT
ncbi:hypothetical protein ABZX92_31095 [Lentzea sp. NPDC006480]|uniref:hypothetical protein n=1 Tax=Lentzea sp. NPDC006480 TaxID=3157176 RepID=UPI0033B02FDD